MAYDPRDLGARCDLCVLKRMRTHPPVPAEINRGSLFLAVGEHPGDSEIEHMRPFVGRAGEEMMISLHSAGVKRGDVSFTNAVLCKPPEGMDQVERTMKRENTARAKAGLGPIPWPATCCRPRLLEEIRQHHGLMALGTLGHRAIIGKTEPEVELDDWGKKKKQPAILTVRGFPGEIQFAANGNALIDLPAGTHVTGAHAVRYMPTVNPAFVLHQRRWTKIFRSDVHRGVRMFRGDFAWREPLIYTTPTPAQLREFLLGRRMPFWSVDVETDSKYALQAKLRCIGFGSVEEAMVVPLLGIDGVEKFYPYHEEEEILDIMRRFFVDPTRVKYGWNFGFYDTIVIQSRLGVVPKPIVDGILFHHVVDSELPHGLAFVGSYIAEPPRNWKADHTATRPKSNQALWEYNGIDVVVAARLETPLEQGMELRNQVEASILDHKVQTICVGMHTLGMHINQARRAERDRLAMHGREFRPQFSGDPKKPTAYEKLKARLDSDHAMGRINYSHIVHQDGTIVEKGIVHYRLDCQIASGTDYSPGSYPKVREILFDRWGLPLDTKDYTEAGAPSTNDKVLLKLLGKKLKSDQRDYLQALRWYRRKVKERGTYSLKLKSCLECISEEDQELLLEVEKGEEDEKGERAREVRKLKRGATQLDGRIHPVWNAHVVPTGRLSSSDPINAQAIPKLLRDMIDADEGNLLIGCDMDQLELRVVSGLANAARDLEIFDRVVKAKKAGKKTDKLDPKQDPYSGTAEGLYGAQWASAGTEAREGLRQFAKIFRLGCQYGAGPDTVWDILRSSEDKYGNLIYLNLQQREVRRMYDNWCRTNPEIVAWWGSTCSEFERDGYLIEPYSGRRRDFLDGLEDGRNEIINFRGQAIAATLVARMMIDITSNLIPFFKWGPNTGLIQNGHDALVFEVPEKLAPVLTPQVEEAMEVRVKGLDVTFTASAKFGKTMDQV